MTEQTSAAELIAASPIRWPNETAEYRQARNALLVLEIELRRQIEAVAAERRQLPPGPEVTRDYRFRGAEGETSLAALFGDKDTLVVYCYMFGAQRERPCPMCTALLAAWEGEVPEILQNAGFAVIAGAPLDRLLAFKAERGWRHLPLYQDADGDFSRDYAAIVDGEDIPQFLVFTRRDGAIRLFWAGEMGGWTADPGQDPRGAPDLMPIWTILDATPAGRAPDWYPRLSY